jgi:hypothetical protein
VACRSDLLPDRPASIREWSRKPPANRSWISAMERLESWLTSRKDGACVTYFYSILFHHYYPHRYLNPPSGLALCIEVKDRKTVGSASLSSLPTEVGGGRIFFFFCRNGSKNREPSAFIASRSHADERSNKGFFFYYYFFRVPESLS